MVDEDQGLEPPAPIPPQPLFERGSSRVEGGEEEAFEIGDSWHLLQAPPLLVQLTSVKLPLHRHADEAAIKVVGPAVVRTGEGPRVAAVEEADFHAAVRAAVDQHANFAFDVAHQDYRHFAH